MHAFVIMPFAHDFTNVYSEIRNACAKATNQFLPNRIEPFRLDESHAPTSIDRELQARLTTADIVIADVSGSTPNVMWEVGFAMALNKPVILITQSVKESPFDLRNVRHIEYDADSLAATLTAPLAESIAIVAAECVATSHVTVGAGYLSAFVDGALTPVYFLDKDFNIKFVNTAASAIFGFQGNEWIGMTLREFMSAIAPRIPNMGAHDENLQRQIKEIERLERAGLARHVPPNFEPVVMVTPSGEIRLTKCGIPVKNGNSGEVQGWVVLFHLEDVPKAILAMLGERVRGVIEARHRPLV